MKKQFDSGIRVKIREDYDAGVVRAFFATDDDDHLEVATINAAMLRDNPGLFEKWSDMLSAVMRDIVSRVTGIEAGDIKFVENRPHERN